MKRTSLILSIMALVFTVYSCKNKPKKDQQKDAQQEMKAPDNSESQMNKDKAAENAAQKSSKKAVAMVEPKEGSHIFGKVVFTQENGKVTMEATLKGLTAGEHAIHIHENPDCSDAGGHWNPTDQPHGKWGAEKGYHRGDIGNFKANAEGVATMTFTTDKWCIGCGDAKKDILKHSIIIHQGTDDFTSQPSGDAGARVGCGVIELKE